MNHIDRIEAYLDRREQMLGMDPEVINGLDGIAYQLRVADLRQLIADARSSQPHHPATIVLGFEDFWEKYPRKVGKKEAAKAWAKLSREQRRTALSVIDGHVWMWAQEGRGTRLVPHASTWLNQWRFDDEIGFVPERDVRPVNNGHTRSADVLGRMEGR